MMKVTNINLNPVNTPLNQKWLIKNSDLSSINETLVGGSFTSWATSLFTNPSNWLVSIRSYPFNPEKFINISTVKETISYGSGLFGGRFYFDVDGRKVKENQYNEAVTINEIEIKPYFNNFMDYAPYTKITMYLPFIKFVDLPVNEVMGNIVVVKYVIDFDIGVATAYISVKTPAGENEHVILMESGQIGFEYPFGSSNAHQIAQSVTQTALAVASAIILKSPSAGKTAALIGGGLVNAINNISNYTITRGGCVGGRSSAFAPNSVYLIIERPKIVPIDSNYARTKGLPLGEFKTLNSLTGYTVVGDIHLDGFNTATDSEINEIESLLKNGIIL